MRLADKALAAEEGGMRWDGLDVAVWPFAIFLHVRIDAPLSRESRWRDGKEASRQAPVVEKGSSSARPGLDFPPFFPFPRSHSASPSPAAFTALPERSYLCLSQTFRSRLCSEPPIPRSPPFFRPSSAMRTASTALGVMDGPKIATFGSACPGGFKFIKLVTFGPGTDSEAEFVNSMWYGGTAGRIVKHDRFNVAPARHKCSRDAVYIFKKKHNSISQHEGP